MPSAWILHNRPLLDAKDHQAVTKVLSSQWVAEGAITRTFEQETAGFLKRRYAKAVSTGTAALHLALLALQIGRGDEVLLSTYSCTALLNAIHYTGAVPVLADIDERNLGPSRLSLRWLVNRKTRAIIVNHAFGFPADILKIKEFGIPVVEDCAQALGGSIDGEPLGSFGDLSICSFYATKMITSGCGGMVLTHRRKWAGRIRDLSHYDQRSDYKVRYNYSLSDLSSALGLSQLKKLGNFVRKRTMISKRYEQILRSTDFYYWTGQRRGECPNFYRFPIGSLRPFAFYKKIFARHKIQIISPLEPYQLLHRYLDLDRKRFPVAEALSRTLISVPIYPALSPPEVDRICRVLKELN